MKHLTEDELFSLQNQESLSNENEMHFESCLFCQSQLNESNQFDLLMKNRLEKTELTEIDIRQDVFDRLHIDFKIEDKKDYFNELSIAFLAVSAIVIFYIFPVSINLGFLYNWLPSDSIHNYYEQFKYPFIIAGSLSILYVLDKLKYILRF